MCPAASALSIIDDVRAFANNAVLRDDTSAIFVGVNG
jgi:hypothetical protein